MPLINRSDLKYDYTWSSAPGNNPKNDPESGERPKKNFRLNKGEDVLELINEYAEMHKIKDKREALQIEKYLRDRLDDENKTREEVQVWINDLMEKGNQNISKK